MFLDPSHLPVPSGAGARSHPQSLGPLVVPCSYVHPPFAELQRSFGRVCHLFDLGEQPRTAPPWRLHPAVPGRKLEPGKRSFYARSYKVGQSYEEIIVDAMAEGYYPAHHTEAIDFARDACARSFFSKDDWLVAPGSFTERERYVFRPDAGERLLNRCVTLVRMQPKPDPPSLDFLFLDEAPQSVLWILCVEA